MFKGQLYPQQKPAAQFLCNRKRVLLAWEQGTGKTIISAAAVDKLFTMEKASSALVLAPSSFAWQWEDKLKEFTDREVTYVTRKDKKAREYTPHKHGFTIVPYSLFRRDFDKIVTRSWDIVIADEAQEFSNNKSVTADKVRTLMRTIDPQYRWLLTGTAISNKLEELYALMYTIDREFLGPWPQFEKRHVLRNELGAIYGYKNLNVLHQHLQNRMDRKTHADMEGEMPKLLEEVVTVERTKEYNEAEKLLLSELDHMVENITFDEEGNPSLPQSSPVRKAFARVLDLLWTEPRKKSVLRRIYKLLDENPDNRIVVFSGRKDPLYDLNNELNSPWSQLAAYFTGDQSAEEKRESVQRFKDGRVRVLLCSDAANSGLDLPFARYLLNALIPFSHGKFDQRNKRVTRLSSEFPSVVAAHFVTENGIDQFYYNQVKSKGRLATATLEGGEDGVVVRPQSLRKFLHGET